MYGGGNGETSDQSSGTELGGASTGRKDGADSNVFNEGRVDLGALDECLESSSEEICSCCILESALAALGEGCSESASYDDLYTAKAVLSARARKGWRPKQKGTGKKYIIWALLQKLCLGRGTALGSREVARDLGKTGLCC